MVTDRSPLSGEELRHVLAENESIQIVGSGTSLNSELAAGCIVRMNQISGILDVRPQDLTCSLRSGTTLAELQATLGEQGLCIPTSGSTGTVGGAYMSRSGTGDWRDWVIGATFMLADGTIAKSGSHAVKSVAGYDVHRFMAGTRGSLAICLELILRVSPISSMESTVGTVTSDHAEISDPTLIRLMKRAKAIFDPSNKLNPGEWGFM